MIQRLLVAGDCAGKIESKLGQPPQPKQTEGDLPLVLVLPGNRQGGFNLNARLLPVLGLLQQD